MDLLIINPGNRQQTYQSLGNELTAVEPPVWAGLIATFAKKHGIDVDILDANALMLTPARVAQVVDDYRPALAVVVVYGHQPSASTQNMPSAGDIARHIKLTNPEQKVAMVGGHVASLPERTLQEECVDFVSVGEGLWTVIDLVRMLKSTAITPADLMKVRGLGFFSKGRFFSTPDAPLVQDVDECMPTLPWDDLPMDMYRAHNWHCFGGLARKPYASIYTTLGCPFKCSFCCIQAPFRSGERASGMSDTRNSYRYWSPASVGSTLQYLHERYGVTNVKFADEMFVLNRKHVEGICDEIIARGLKLNIWAYARVDTVKDGMLDKLKRAGFTWLAFGIESANSSIRDGVDKGFTDVEMLKCIRDVRAAGINVGANYIFGLPEDDHDTMQQTLDLAKVINAEYANFYSAMAYPGSPLYDQAVASGDDLPKSWSGYSQHSVDCRPLPTRHLKPEEIVAFRDAAFIEYFTSPSYRSMMMERFGPAALAEVEVMLSHRLDRAGAKR